VNEIPSLRFFPDEFLSKDSIKVVFPAPEGAEITNSLLILNKRSLL
jgi:hypothetical protein